MSSSIKEYKHHKIIRCVLGVEVGYCYGICVAAVVVPTDVDRAWIYKHCTNILCWVPTRYSQSSDHIDAMMEKKVANLG
jgi:hypothetical protein